jgi:hypothetical protein
MLGNSLWLVIIAGGPVILGAIIAYALLTRRNIGPAERRESAAATDRLYRKKS